MLEIKIGNYVHPSFCFGICMCVLSKGEGAKGRGGEVWPNLDGWMDEIMDGGFARGS